MYAQPKRKERRGLPATEGRMSMICSPALVMAMAEISEDPVG